MAHQNDDTLVSVSDCKLDIEALLASCDIDMERGNENWVVIVPTNFQREDVIVSFPAGTIGFYRFIQENFADDYVVEISSKDEDYTELALHSTDIFLPAIYVTSNVVLPIIINVISSYVSKLLSNKKSDNEDSIVDSTIHYEDENGKKVAIEYKGPASTFESVVNSTLHGTGGEQQ